MIAQEKPTSRNIPHPIQREVRQRCGFGCIVCGIPFYEYHHLLGWANVKRHVADEITLLCSLHHDEEKRGLLSVEQISKANTRPVNMQSGVSNKFDLSFEGDSFEIQLGKTTFTLKEPTDGALLAPVVIDGVVLLGFTLVDNNLLLNLTLFDEFNEKVLEISQNQLIQSISHWDIQFVKNNIKKREAKRKILIDIDLLIPNKIRINKGRFLLNGIEMIVNKESLKMLRSEFRVKNFVGYSIGFALGVLDDNIPCAVRIKNINRYVSEEKVKRDQAKKQIV